MCTNKLKHTHTHTNIHQLWLSVDAILLRIYHQTALQLPEKTGSTCTLTYTDLLLVEHECRKGRNYQKKSEIPSQEVHDDDILPFLEMKIKLKMSCDTTLHLNSLKVKYYTIAIMQWKKWYEHSYKTKWNLKKQFKFWGIIMLENELLLFSWQRPSRCVLTNLYNILYTISTQQYSSKMI